MASEAVKATGLLGEKFKDVGVLGITSSDNLYHDWKNKYSSNENNNKNSHIEYLLKIIPKDTKNDPYSALLAAQELKNKGVKIIIGPVFNENLKNLNKIEGVTFLSFTNKIIENPKNVIAGGINAISQLQTMN